MPVVARTLNFTRRFLFWFLSIAIALASVRYLLLGMEAAFPNMLHQLDAQRFAFYAHVIAGPIAMVIVPFQFWGKLRTRRPTVHRWLGRTYALMILIAGLSGLVIALNTNAGAFAATGFFILGLLWLWSTAQAVLHARAGRIAQHKDWMIRSAALTFAGVTLRLWLAGSITQGIPFETAYPVIAWLCWVPNIVIAEYLVRKEPGSAVAA